MKFLCRLACYVTLTCLSTLSLAQDRDDDDLPTVPVPKNGYQCVDWQGIRRERTMPCSETGETEFRGYDHLHDAKRDIKKLVDSDGKLKVPSEGNREHTDQNSKKTSNHEEELSPEEKKRRRNAWIKFIGVALVFGFIAKMKKASFIRWAIVGVFVYGTLVLGNFVAL